MFSPCLHSNGFVPDLEGTKHRRAFLLNSRDLPAGATKVFKEMSFLLFFFITTTNYNEVDNALESESVSFLLSCSLSQQRFFLSLNHIRTTMLITSLQAIMSEDKAQRVRRIDTQIIVVSEDKTRRRKLKRYTHIIKLPADAPNTHPHIIDLPKGLDKTSSLEGLTAQDAIVTTLYKWKPEALADLFGRNTLRFSWSQNAGDGHEFYVELDENYITASVIRNF